MPESIKKDERILLERVVEPEAFEEGERKLTKEYTEVVVGEFRKDSELTKELRSMFPKKVNRHPGSLLDKGNEHGMVIMMVDVESRQLLRNWRQRAQLRNYSEAIKQVVALAVSSRVQEEEENDEVALKRIEELRLEEEVKEIETLRSEELQESSAYWGEPSAAWSVVKKLAALHPTQPSGEAVQAGNNIRLASILTREAKKDD